MKRRSLLQAAGMFCGAWGANQLLLSRASQVLAEPTSRKLALLIGINQYRNAGLNGCVTDIELQKELLIYRFGFQPSDIVVLTNQQATRSQIETVFTEHLIQQAKPNDVVVFHFSGFGSLQKLGTTAEDVQPVLLTADDPREDAIANVISQDTLLLLLRSLSTSQVTTVLDAGYFYPGYSQRGNLRLRSRERVPEATRPSDPISQLIPAELEFQEKLLVNTGLDRVQTRVKWRSGQFPGVVLSAANDQQFATESPWNGFSAGLFTYGLTQQLWQAIPSTTLRVNLRQASELIAKRVDPKQQPILMGQKSRDRPLKPYQISLIESAADGVITAIEDSGKIAQLWLGGLSPEILEAYSSGTVLKIENSDQLLQVFERNGLVAKARSLTESPNLQIGQRVRERIRALPKDVRLAIAIDANLNRVERVDAVSALSGLPKISAAIAGEQPADYLFSKVEETTQVAALNPDAMKGTISPAGYGLFSQGRDAIPQTTGESGEAVKLAVRRLAPRLQTLLGAKLLNLTSNAMTSQLSIRASLETADSSVAVQQTETVSSDSVSVIPSDGKILSFPVGTPIRLRVENRDVAPIHFVILGLDNRGLGIVLNLMQNERSQTSIASNETVTIPRSLTDWTLQAPSGLFELYLICSRAPFQQTQALLGTGAEFVRSLPNFLDVAQAVLQDLHRPGDPSLMNAPDLFALDMTTWATFRFTYQVV
ncbi:caspase family protein [Leptolyngbya sp. NIES-2104]|uniref:caspase family protein n=1 Tax=Leptolyngbya sp. NIES-2104 TaxID=1552121 RepID=UPI0006ECB641|nr:caspase family protein [Leptolyngbya sp. NIES-2104]GAP94759.1 caspase-1, p20 [Leptolyngbya sp. NIES-2104]